LDVNPKSNIYNLKMARYQVTLAYDGTLFEGFQRQRRKTLEARTVQGVVEAALRQLGWQGHVILAAGRTDTGVHASGQVVAFDLEWNHATEALLAALNANLPEDVAAKTVKIAPASFHPRYDALARRYRYSIYCQPMRNPLKDRYAWRVWPAVELETLQAVAGQLLGTHDYSAFGAPPRGVGSTVRSVFQAVWQAEEPDLVFEVVANAFLYRMVRRLVYAQVMIGQDKLPQDTILVSLESQNPEMIQGLAPAQGLVLVEVIYK
jgi:tRNA pseudouridine38-40 synthase